MMHRREHYLDTCRAVLMLLGIPYHAALVYDPEMVWLIYTQDNVSFLGFLAELLHSFRMPVFFLIAGYYYVMKLANLLI